MTVEEAIKAILEAMHNDNEDLNLHIKNLKDAMKSEDVKEAVFDPAALVQNNREGRKRMQSYFKKRGVKVAFVK